MGLTIASLKPRPPLAAARRTTRRRDDETTSKRASRRFAGGWQVFSQPSCVWRLVVLRLPSSRRLVSPSSCVSRRRSRRRSPLFSGSFALASGIPGAAPEWLAGAGTAFCCAQPHWPSAFRTSRRGCFGWRLRKAVASFNASACHAFAEAAVLHGILRRGGNLSSVR